MSDAEQVDLVETYQDAVRRVALVVAMLDGIDFQQLIRAIDHANAVGPLLEPTAWRNKAQAMREDRALLAAAQVLVGALKRPASSARKLRGEVDV